MLVALDGVHLSDLRNKIFVEFFAPILFHAGFDMKDMVTLFRAWRYAFGRSGFVHCNAFKLPTWPRCMACECVCVCMCVCACVFVENKEERTIVGLQDARCTEPSEGHPQVLHHFYFRFGFEREQPDESAEVVLASQYVFIPAPTHQYHDGVYKQLQNTMQWYPAFLAGSAEARQIKSTCTRSII